MGTSGTVETGGKQKVWGIRSMDDVVMVASFKLGDQQSERNAVRRIEQLKYHESMNWKEPIMTQQSGKGIWKERSAYSGKGWM